MNPEIIISILKISGYMLLTISVSLLLIALIIAHISSIYDIQRLFMKSTYKKDSDQPKSKKKARNISEKTIHQEQDPTEIKPKQRIIVSVVSDVEAEKLRQLFSVSDSGFPCWKDSNLNIQQRR